MKKIMFLSTFMLLSLQHNGKSFPTSTTVIETYKKKHKNANLYEFIGLNINSEKVKRYLKNLGNYEFSTYFEECKDYHYENSGIQFRTDKDGLIIAIFCFNKNERIMNMPVRFSGKLPFQLTFDDSLEDIHRKIGEGTIFMRQGFYGRIFQWTIQDSLKISIEMELPKNENDKLFIEQFSLSKNK